MQNFDIPDAHQNAVSLMALTFNGSLLASASITGRKVKLFDTNMACLITQLARGEEIYSTHNVLAFSENGKNLWEMRFDLNKVHVWKVDQVPSTTQNKAENSS